MNTLPPDYVAARQAEALDILADLGTSESLKRTAWRALKSIRRATLADARPCDTQPAA